MTTLPACEAFNCIPYFAIVADERDLIRVFIISKERLLQIAPMRSTSSGWKMTKSSLERYAADESIIYFELEHRMKRWFEKPSRAKNVNSRSRLA
jgi:hypothetical protein